MDRNNNNENEISNIIKEKIQNLYSECYKEENINKSFVRLLNSAISPEPIRDRVFAGLSQSVTIRFGNLIEDIVCDSFISSKDYKLVKTIVSNAKTYNVKGSSGILFEISNRNRILINEYVTWAKNRGHTSDEIKNYYSKLISSIYNNVQEELAYPEKYTSKISKYDVDCLFFNVKNNNFYYAEIKKEDNHDSGKDADICKKVLETYAGLLKAIVVSADGKKIHIDNLTPMLMIYGTPGKDTYFPRGKSFCSGKEFFNTYLTPVTQEYIEKCISSVHNDPKIMEIKNNANTYINNFKYSDRYNLIANPIIKSLKSK